MDGEKQYCEAPGCGRVISPIRLEVSPATKVCSSLCARARAKVISRESMQRLRDSRRAKGLTARGEEPVRE